jgi:hypothetical protein
MGASGSSRTDAPSKSTFSTCIVAERSPNPERVLVGFGVTATRGISAVQGKESQFAAYNS